MLINQSFIVFVKVTFFYQPISHNLSCVITTRVNHNGVCVCWCVMNNSFTFLHLFTNALTVARHKKRDGIEHLPFLTHFRFTAPHHHTHAPITPPRRIAQRTPQKRHTVQEPTMGGGAVCWPTNLLAVTQFSLSFQALRGSTAGREIDGE